MKKIGSFSLIERVILSAGAMLIFSVSFQIDQMPRRQRRKKKRFQRETLLSYRNSGGLGNRPVTISLLANYQIRISAF